MMKKPKVWDIAVLTGIVLLIVMLAMVHNDSRGAYTVCLVW